MNVRAVLVLGFFLVAAAVLHGGMYSAGHDFVVNRYTGSFQFVPAEDAEEETGMPVRAQCLTVRRAAATRVLTRRR